MSLQEVTLLELLTSIGTGSKPFGWQNLEFDKVQMLPHYVIVYHLNWCINTVVAAHFCSRRGSLLGCCGLLLQRGFS